MLDAAPAFARRSQLSQNVVKRTGRAARGGTSTITPLKTQKFGSNWNCHTTPAPPAFHSGHNVSQYFNHIHSSTPIPIPHTRLKYIHSWIQGL